MSDNDADPREVAGALRRYLAAVDAGELDAGPLARAYIAGAADALDGRFDPASQREADHTT